MSIVIPFDDYLELYAEKNPGPLPTGNEPTVKKQIEHVMSPYFNRVAAKHDIDFFEDDF